MRLHAPIIRGVVIAIGLYLGIVLVFTYLFHVPFVFLWCFMFLGVLYTGLFEYGYHRFVIHESNYFLFLLKFRMIRSLRIGHRYHHAMLHGAHAQTRDPKALLKTVTSWFIFPALLLVHYVVFSFFMPREKLSSFFFGVSSNFLFYEITHWCTHVRGNLLDRMIISLPFIGVLRRYYIRWHLGHHDNELVNFSFSQPPWWDFIFRTKGALKKL